MILLLVFTVTIDIVVVLVLLLSKLISFATATVLLGRSWHGTPEHYQLHRYYRHANYLQCIDNHNTNTCLNESAQRWYETDH